MPPFKNRDIAVIKSMGSKSVYKYTLIRRIFRCDFRSTLVSCMNKIFYFIQTHDMSTQRGVVTVYTTIIINPRYDKYYATIIQFYDRFVYRVSSIRSIL